MSTKKIENECWNPCENDEQTYLHNLTKTADIAWAFDWIARIVSLLLPAQKPPPASTVEAPDPPGVSKDFTSRLEDEGGVVGMGFDWSMMVHSASCTVLNSWSHNCTGLGRLKRKREKLKISLTLLLTFLNKFCEQFWLIILACRLCYTKAMGGGGLKTLL